MALLREDAFRVGCETDRFWCAREARRFASEVGFAELAQWEIAIVVAELVANAVRHAGSGTVTFRRAPGPRAGMQIVVANESGEVATAGPAERAPAAGARRGLGLGLKTVRLLTDSVSIEAGVRGLVVTASRYLAP